jgi:cytidine deaminase
LTARFTALRPVEAAVPRIRGVNVDWGALRAAATDAMRKAYAPYSNFPVGAAALVDDGRVVVGCNVENASYGLGLCAECGLVSALHAGGGGRLVALACVDGAGGRLLPCGRCRQLLWEHGGPSLAIDASGGPITMVDLLPHAFDATDLGRAAPAPGGWVPARLAEHVGRGTVFVHPEVAGGQQVWTGYWGGDEPAGIIEEGPVWPRAADGIAWGRARTPRVVIVDARGTAYWAGAGPRPAEIAEEWR